MRPVILPLAKRLGLKPMVIIGTFGVALQYPMLAEVDGVGVELLLVCIVVVDRRGVLLAVLQRLFRRPRRRRASRPPDQCARGAGLGDRHRRAASRRVGAGDARSAPDVRRGRPGAGAGGRAADRRAERRGQGVRARRVSRGAPRRDPRWPPMDGSTPGSSSSGRSRSSSPSAKASRPTAARWRWRRSSARRAGCSSAVTSIAGHGRRAVADRLHGRGGVRDDSRRELRLAVAGGHRERRRRAALAAASAGARNRDLQSRQGLALSDALHIVSEGGWDIGCFGACLAAAALVNRRRPAVARGSCWRCRRSRSRRMCSAATMRNGTIARAARPTGAGLAR